LDKSEILPKIDRFSIQVVPVTAGLGIISNFSATVCAILRFLGVNAEITRGTDAAGVALAFENGVDAIMMADDQRFIGINLHTRSVIDNSLATGRVYGAALDLMADGLRAQEVLVLGCGPVGASAARWLLGSAARMALFDIDNAKSQALCKKLGNPENLIVEGDLTKALERYRYIVDATPAPNFIPESLLKNNSYIACPGVPQGVSARGQLMLGNRLIHDKLELGVAAMAVALLLA